MACYEHKYDPSCPVNLQQTMHAFLFHQAVMETEGRSLTETPTWAVATVITIMVTVGISFHASLNRLWKWLDKTKRNALLAALDKIKDELMVFGVLSLLMGHWIEYVADICVRSSAMSSHFHICGRTDNFTTKKFVLASRNDLDTTFSSEQENAKKDHHCPEGHRPFASEESLEQLHRFMFVLAAVHVSYSFVAVALAIIKISSWRIWENHAKSLTHESTSDASLSISHTMKMRRLASFIIQHVSHPWSQNRVLVWLLCFYRQFWSSINQADYMALRLGFITTHQLPLTYDFHRYMLRGMDEEFSDIVGISVPHWIYAMLCIFLEFHDTYAYFWLSFVPAILILLIGTKLHRVVVKLAVEIIDNSPSMGTDQFNLRDDLFWFGKPKLLLRLIQLIAFQNAFEMATYIWSLWEIKDPSCFMENKIFIVIRLTFGVVTQIWCSYITFPLYVIVREMGSKFKKSVISENMRQSLTRWQKRVREKRSVSTKKGSSSGRFKSNIGSSSHSSGTGKGSFFKGEDFLDEAFTSKGIIDEEMSISWSDHNSGTPLRSLLYGDDKDDDGGGGGGGYSDDVVSSGQSSVGVGKDSRRLLPTS